MYNNSVMKWLQLCLAGALLCAVTNLSAQTPGKEFLGEWIFTKAQAKERPLNSKGSFTPRDIAKEDLKTYNYFWQVPTYINFMDGDKAIVENFWGESAPLTVMFHPNNDNMIEFYEVIYHGEDDFEYNKTIPPFYHLTVNGNTMSMTYGYFYSNPNKTYTDGVLTIYYKR